RLLALGTVDLRHQIGEASGGAGVARALPRGRLGDEMHALLDFTRYALARFGLPADLVAPGGEEVAPGDNGELVGGLAIDGKLAAPAAIVVKVQRRFAPCAVADGAVQHRSGRLVVAVAEDVGLDAHTAADHGLGREAAAVDFRGDGLDGDAGVGQFVQAHVRRLIDTDAAGLVGSEGLRA